MILDRPDIGVDAFAAGTAWAIKPEGACKGEICGRSSADFAVQH
jgi:hypothetical protein